MAAWAEKIRLSENAKKCQLTDPQITAHAKVEARLNPLGPSLSPATPPPDGVSSASSSSSSSASSWLETHNIDQGDFGTSLQYVSDREKERILQWAREEGLLGSPSTRSGGAAGGKDRHDALESKTKTKSSKKNKMKHRERIGSLLQLHMKLKEGKN